MHLFLKLFILAKHFHVSDGPSVHHQELKTANTATNVSQTTAAVSGDEMELHFHLIPANSSSCLRHACCCICSLELLMMDGETV
jgi:hypothetical protein